MITFEHIIQLNKQLEEQGSKLHLRDTCSGQSLWLESGNALRDWRLIRDYFGAQQIFLRHSDDYLTFWEERGY